jgi:phosphoribosylglycinamide formyltransferase-1
MARLKTAVLISGRGSNLQALIDACVAPGFPAEIALVIANVGGAAGLARAHAAGIATRTTPHGDYGSREAFEARLTEELESANVGLVCLAGFMRILTPSFVARWRDRLVNIHPSLLPAYPGTNTHARAIADGVRIAGCTVHFVRAEVDHGPIVVQAAVPVLPGDDEAALAARVLATEHRAYPLALRLIAEGRVRIVGDRCVIDGDASPGMVLINPAEGA